MAIIENDLRAMLDIGYTLEEAIEIVSQARSIHVVFVKAVAEMLDDRRPTLH